MALKYRNPLQCFSLFLGQRIVKTIHCYKKFLTVALVLVSKFLSNNGFELHSKEQNFFFSAKELLKLFILKKNLICCICFSVQNISNNGVRIHSPKQCFSAMIGKMIVKTMPFYKNPNSTARRSKVTVTSQMVTLVTVTMVTKNRLYIVVIL